MRVLHLDTGRAWRGGQVQVLQLVRGLGGQGIANELCAPRGPLLERARTEGISVTPWRPRGDLDPWAVVRLGREARRFGPDLLHAHSAHAHVAAALVGRRLGIPVVVARRVAKRVRRHAWSRAKYALRVDRYLCVSRAVVEAMRASGIPETRLALVPSGIDFAALRRVAEGGEDLRQRIGAASDDPVVGTVAALTREKGHRRLLEAAAVACRKEPRLRLVWIGEGPERESLARHATRLGLADRVHLLGFRPDAHALMRQFTLFALCSDLEGLGTSLLEAQGLGVPVLATAVGGMPEVIENERTGLLVPPGDRDALVRALERALTDPEARARWATQAARSAARFDVAATVERTLAVYREVVPDPRMARV